MGMFEVKVKLANLATPSRTEEASLLVDTGATLSWIPRQVLESLGATVLSRLPFELADGRRLERDITTVLFTIDGRKAPVPVAFGKAGEAAVLGATALESLGLMVALSPKSSSLGTCVCSGRLSCSEKMDKSPMETCGTNSHFAAYPDLEERCALDRSGAEEVRAWSF